MKRGSDIASTAVAQLSSLLVPLYPVVMVMGVRHVGTFAMLVAPNILCSCLGMIGVFVNLCELPTPQHLLDFIVFKRDRLVIGSNFGDVLL